MKRIILTALALILLASPAVASLAPDFMIQGVLTDNTGAPLPDDEYLVQIRLWSAPSGGMTMHSQTAEVNQIYGVFTTMIESVYWEVFDDPVWVEFTMEGEAPMTPRIPLTAAPVALRAATVDPANAVTGINNIKGNVSIVGGANVTVTHSWPRTFTISAVNGAGVDDGDWTISGQDLFHGGSGTVAIGTGTPTPIYQDQDYTTMQVSGYLLSALCLDQSSSGSRWAMINGGDNMTIGHSDSPSSYPSPVMKVSEAGTELFGPTSGERQIHLRPYDGMGDGGSIWLYGPQTSEATLRITGATGYGGGHMQVYNGNDQLEVTITGNFQNTDVGRIITPVLEITGGSDLSEQFDIGNTSLLPEPGMVVSIDPDNPGQLALCEKAYDRRVAGVISGAGGVNTGMLMGQSDSEADGEHPVALVGRVYVWADATSGPIEPGDLLTTGDLPGHAMKVSDHSRAMGAILGKAMTSLSEGQGLILTLVSLQ
jgi:hypothetical protein